jgi:hypothetical protein
MTDILHRKPLLTVCSCPVLGKSRAGAILVAHSADCLSDRRGARTLDAYYGPPAGPRPRRAAWAWSSVEGAE